MKTFRDYMNEDTDNEVESDEEEENEVYYPKGVYIAVKMMEESVIALKAYMEKYLPNVELHEDLHSTLIYSKEAHKEEIEPDEYQAIGVFKRFSKFGENEDVLVVEIESESLLERNKALVNEYGFISDYDEYKPHFTISYEAADIDVNTLPEMDFAVYFNEESVEQIDEDYGKKDNDDESKEYDSETSDTLVGKALSKMKSKDDKEDKEEEPEK